MNIFEKVQLKKPQTSTFDLTHDVKMSAKMGKLIPICNMEALPGDKFNIGTDTLVRFAPLTTPTMHRFDVSIHYFFVPNRILWSNWEKFITGAQIMGVEAPPVHPYITLKTAAYDLSSKPLADYLGIPKTSKATDDTRINALPLAAYQAIYNEYYRDQNLIDALYQPQEHILFDGNNTGNQKLTELRTRAWEHDYFTSALPWAQKGAAVKIPVGGGDVVLKSPLSSSGFSALIKDADDNNTTSSDTSLYAQAMTGILKDSLGNNKVIDPNGTLEVNVEAANIRDLRRAFKLQEWLEKNARAGTRYIESILVHFGVKSSDKRLNRPEYITGVKTPVIISEILNTTGELDGLVQGNMSGHGVSVASGKYGSYYCEEHGWIIGIMSVMPKTAYQQGIHRSLIKEDKFDYYFPEFAHIGEQEIFNKELYVDSPNGNDTFGYIPRYSELKFMNNRVAGDFKTTLKQWHASRIFNTQPNLNQQFIECKPDNRIFMVDDDIDNLYCQVLNKVSVNRKMPYFGNPSF